MIITWLYTSTNRSVLLVMALHLIMNVSGEYFGPMFSGASEVTFAGLKAAIFALAAIAIVVWSRPARLSRRPLMEPDIADKPVGGT